MRAKRKKIKESDLKGFKYFKALSGLLDHRNLFPILQACAGLSSSAQSEQKWY
jgi:hypothetical protein